MNVLLSFLWKGLLRQVIVVTEFSPLILSSQLSGVDHLLLQQLQLDDEPACDSGRSHLSDGQLLHLLIQAGCYSGGHTPLHRNSWRFVPKVSISTKFCVDHSKKQDHLTIRKKAVATNNWHSTSRKTAAAINNWLMKLINFASSLM